MPLATDAAVFALPMQADFSPPDRGAKPARRRPACSGVHASSMRRLSSTLEIAKKQALLKELHRVDQGSVNAPQERDADEAPGQRQLKGGGGGAAIVVKAHIASLKPPRRGHRPSRGPYD